MGLTPRLRSAGPRSRLDSAARLSRDQDEDEAESPLASWSGYWGRRRPLLGRFSAGLSACRPW